MVESRPRLKRWLARAVLFLFTLLLCFAGLEFVVRQFLTTTTVDGQVIYANQLWVLPRSLPVRQTEDTLDAYYEHPDSYVEYDPLLGWTLRPLAASENGLYTANTAGLRADREYTRDPPADQRRIALFGDSFTHGDDVPLEDTWAYRLDEQLDDAEVLNFGVGGYGIDQAYLRWHYMGQEYQPDIVVLGFLDADVFRNVNVIRALNTYFTGLSLSKPRFVLDADGQLSLINSPTIPPDQLVEAIRDFPGSPLAPYEYFYNPADFEHHWYLNSRLIAVLLTIQKRAQVHNLSDVFDLDLDMSEHPHLERLLDPSSEAAQITLAILKQWSDEVEAQGGQFVIVHLPRIYEVEQYRASQEIAFPALYAELQQYTLIETLAGFDSLPTADYFVEGGHYSAAGNQVIAETVAAWIKAQE